MFCPNCRCEYGEGVKYCSECSIGLVYESPNIETSESEDIFLRYRKIKSNTKMYLMNSIFGFTGGPLFLLFLTFAATQSQPLPPEWGMESRTKLLPLFIMILYFIIIISVNIIGLMAFVRKNKATGDYGVKLLRFISLNLIIYIFSFVTFMIISLKTIII